MAQLGAKQLVTQALESFGGRTAKEKPGGREAGQSAAGLPERTKDVGREGVLGDPALLKREPGVRDSLQEGLGNGEHIRWQFLMGRDNKVSTHEHAGGTITSINARGVQVLQHCPGLPAAHQSGVQGVNVGADECHAAPIAKCTSSDVAGSQAQGKAQDSAAGFEGSGNHTGSDTAWASLGVISVQRGVSSGAVFAKV